eukprot:85065-Prymnesium_polylepis.1
MRLSVSRSHSLLSDPFLLPTRPRTVPSTRTSTGKLGLIKRSPIVRPARRRGARLCAARGGGAQDHQLVGECACGGADHGGICGM